MERQSEGGEIEERIAGLVRRGDFRQAEVAALLTACREVGIKVGPKIIDIPPEVIQREPDTMPRTERGRELARRRARKAKLTKLRTRYAAAKSDADKQVIFEKARKLSPFVEMEPAKAS